MDEPNGMIEARAALLRVAELITEDLLSVAYPHPPGIARALRALGREMRHRGAALRPGPGATELTTRQRMREMRRADPENPLYWTPKQVARAARNAALRAGEKITAAREGIA